MAGFLYKGILLQQQKEPALSRDLREFFNADTSSIQMNRQPVGRPDDLTPDQIIEIAREAHIVDERDGKLLADKLMPGRKRSCQLLVADAIDDEPYISSQLNPMLKNQRLTSEGLKFAQRATGAHDAHFAVYKNLTDLEIKIPKKIGDYHVRRIRGRYPAEYQASEHYAVGNGVVVIGVGAILHLARAIFFNKPQTTSFITVAGNCIGNPTNLEVSLGVTVSQVLERCGLIENPSRVIIGGSMTGISVIDTENTLITPTTRAVLAFREDVKDLHFNCIGCSRCVHVCPEGLNPFFLYRSVKHKRYEDFRTLDAQMCIGCNTCSYMCPAKLDLSETIRAGLEEFRHMTGSMRAASVTAAKQENEAFAQYMEEFRTAKAAREAARAEKRAQREALHAERAEARRIAAESAALAATGLASKLEDLTQAALLEVENAASHVSDVVDDLVTEADEAIAALLQDVEEPVALDESTAAADMSEVVQIVEDFEEITAEPLSDQPEAEEIPMAPLPEELEEPLPEELEESLPEELEESLPEEFEDSSADKAPVPDRASSEQLLNDPLKGWSKNGVRMKQSGEAN